MAERRQELYCHSCDKYVQFIIDDELDGRHVLKCPNCGHEHYRYVDKGRISDRRWGSANRQQTAQTYNISASSISFSSSSTSGTASSATSSYIIWGTSSG